MRCTDVLEQCRLAAEAIQKRPSNEWAIWIYWMIEALDAEGQKMPFVIRDDMIDRVQKGRW